jgi:hypothetical protein
MQTYIVFTDCYKKGRFNTRRYIIQAENVSIACEKAIEKRKGSIVSMFWPV